MPSIAPSLSVALSAFVLLSAGCLNNPAKPVVAGDGGLVGAGDGARDGTSDSVNDLGARADLGTDGGDGATAPAIDATPDVTGAETAPPDGPMDVGCVATCTAGARRCGPGGGVQTCTPGPMGCLDWGTEVGCAGTTRCAGNAPDAACACPTPPVGCTAEGMFCRDPSTLATCVKDAQGCFQVLATTTTCPAGQSCGGAIPNGSCGCSNTCNAAQVGTYCVDAKMVATCTGLNGCFASSNPVACLGAKTCTGAAGAVSCQCPAAGTAAGTGCPTAGVTACDGAGVLTCTSDGSGCSTWVKTTDCAMLAGGPYVCGTRVGSPTCQCPDPAPGKIHVDPVDGNDGATGIPANGAAVPAACRYKTITKALTAVSATRNEIVAATATPPASFSAETFPLVVPAGVKLTTADATPAAGNYTIQFNNDAAAAGLVLADGAVLEGYIVQASGGATGPAISCSSGAVTIRASHVVGGNTNKPATGIAIGRTSADTCTGTIAGVQVRAFRVGIAVTTAAATALAITDSTLRDNGGGSEASAGLLVAAGKVTASTLTINKSATGNATWGVVLDGVSPTASPVLTATELKIAGLARAGLELRQDSGMAAPQATLTGGDIEAGDNNAPGVQVAAGTLAMTGTKVHGADSDGLRVAGGTVTLGAGTALDENGRDGLRVDAGTVTGTGFSASRNTGGALTVSNGVVTAHAATLSSNIGRALMQTGGTVTIDDGSVMKGNGKPMRLSGLRIDGGTFNLGGPTGAKVEVDDSGDDGLKLLPGPTSAVTVTVTRALIHGSARDGIETDIATTGSTLIVTDTDVYSNLDGIRLTRAPAAAGQAVVLDGVRVHTNGLNGMGGLGVTMAAEGGFVTATLKNSTIHGNRDHGVLIRQATGFLTTATLERNDVHGNNTGAGRPVGGVFFATASTLASFTGNKVHGNSGDEIGFGAQPNGGDTWTLGSALACGPATNQIYCYSSTGNSVGLRILSSAQAGTKVDAQGVSWANTVAMKGREYDFADGMTFDVTATPVCTAVVSTCN